MKERFIIEQLLRDNFSPRYKGFNFLMHAILLASATEATPVVTQIYQEVAASFDTSGQNVERCIRNAVEIAWRLKDDPKPTNGDYIALATTLLRIQKRTA